MDYSNMYFIFLRILVLVFGLGNADPETNLIDNRTVTIQKDLYDILLRSLQKSTSEPSYDDLSQKITTLEAQIELYKEDRNQLFHYFNTITEAVKRLMKIEEETDILKRSSHILTNQIQELKSSSHETHNRIQRNENVTVRQSIEQVNLNDDIQNLESKMGKQFQIIMKNQEERYTNQTQIIDNIRYDAERRNVEFSQQFENLTEKVSEIQKSSNKLIDHQSDIVNNTCLKAIVTLNTESETVKQQIAILNERTNDWSKRLSTIADHVDGTDNYIEGLRNKVTSFLDTRAAQEWTT